MNRIQHSIEFKPINYDIWITPSSDNLSFDGIVKIFLWINNPTTSFVLNSLNLTIGKVFISHNDEVFTPKRIEHDKKIEQITIVFDSPIMSGFGELCIEYVGPITTDMVGLYRSEIKPNEFMIVTQFEPMYARRVLPCVDDPAFKATFCITLTIQRDLTAISNSHVLSEEINKSDKNLKTVRFAKTPIMSTYLLAFAVGYIDYTEVFAKTKTKTKTKTETETEDGKTIRIRTYMPINGKNKLSDGEFANSLAVKALGYFSNFFACEYPLEKLDMIAIPDFMAGAMENWGLITYKVNNLLCDHDSSSIEDKIRISLTICHEIAHQWFGNLVTMKTWSDIWLNEGFAKWAELTAVDYFYPEWKVWKTFYLDDMSRALLSDSLSTTHQIEFDDKENICNAISAENIFDDITYRKSCGIIGALIKYIGIDDFTSGMRHYIKTFQYKNVDTNDMWKSLEEKSNKPISRIMKNWTTKTGYPVISVKDNGEHLELTQTKFNTRQDHDDILFDNSNDTLWEIYIAVQSSSDTHEMLMSDKTLIIKSSEFTLINPNKINFIRIDYDDISLAKLAYPIRSKKIDPIDRATIIDDLFTLSFFGHISINRVFNYLINYQNETDYHVLNKIFKHMDDLNSIFYRYPHVSNKMRIMTHRLIINPIKNIERIMERNNDYENMNFKLFIIKRLALCDHPQVILICRKLFAQVINHNELRKIVYAAVAKNGGKKEYKRLLNFVESGKPNVMNDALYALGQFTDTIIVREIMDIILQENSIIKVCDSKYIIKSSMSNAYIYRFVTQYIIDNWDRFINKFWKCSSIFYDILCDCISHLSTTADMDNMRNIILQYDSTIVTKQNICQAFEIANYRASYAQNQRKYKI